MVTGLLENIKNVKSLGYGYISAIISHVGN